MITKFYLAKAGSGKSFFATNLNKKLNKKDVLFITYTNTNIQVLIKYLRNSSINYHSTKVENWNDFLVNNFLAPYKLAYLQKLKIDDFFGISWDREAWKSIAYIDKQKRLFGYKCSKLIMSDKLTFKKACVRLSRFYDYIVIDEFQDITGYDIKFLRNIIEYAKESSLNFLLFGDIYQANVQATNTTYLIRKIQDIYDEESFIKRMYGNDVEVDKTTLIKSHRIGTGVSNFIRGKLHIKISACEKNNATILPLDIADIPTDFDVINNIFERVEKILIYNKRSLKSPYENFRFKCINWGLSKGDTYRGPVAVVLTKEIYKKLKDAKDLDKLSVGTFTKFYVALTRSKSNVYLVYLN